MVHKLRIPGTAKCGFLILLIACGSIFLSFFYFTEETVSQDLNYEDDLYYSPQPVLPFTPEVLDENFDRCIFSTIYSDLGGTNATMRTLFPEIPSSISFLTDKQLKVKKYAIFEVLKTFTDLMASYFMVETVLIEPTILFCMLASQHKDLLIKRKFHFKNFFNSKHIVTFGIRGKDTLKLQKAGAYANIKARGFKMELVSEPLLGWMKTGNTTSSSNQYTSHAFFKYRDWIIHLVPFYDRGNFQWHAALETKSNKRIPFKELYFTESASAYENFGYESLKFYSHSLSNVNIPSNPQFFLFETTSSRFLECNSTIVSSFYKSNQTGVPGDHYSLSVPRFNKRTVIGLLELKAIFNPLLMNFWIWSGTMLGWYRQCDVIPYTSDVDFAAWASQVDDLDDILHRLEQSDHMELRQRMGIVENTLEFNINCHNLRVDVFFLYHQSNGTWYAGHRPSKGYYFKYHHPDFTLCSAQLLDHKVLVPCETEKVIITEYGPEWMKPVTSWNYESSIKNRGPNIYWDKSMLEKVYQNN
ncbi:fukutin [Caerostris darwini]|uniref:Fukutin n=1 Tax=Caerostris darwini TaxID=1538125 RepID=A0AAV4VHC7_9ARAC|nr:fukutin [Caerostris darwini]